jgi:hypothetical protein
MPNGIALNNLGFLKKMYVLISIHNTALVTFCYYITEEASK